MSECLHSVLATKTLLPHGQILQLIKKGRVPEIRRKTTDTSSIQSREAKFCT